VCCDDLIEETCFSEYTGLAESCALITDGGCPCPYGMKKCGATEAHAGYCASVCCGDGQELCYNMNGYQYCADYASGGCPCWPGEMKCGANETYPGMFYFTFLYFSLYWHFEIVANLDVCWMI